MNTDLKRSTLRAVTQLRRLPAVLVFAALTASGMPCGATELQEGKPAPSIRAELIGGGTFDSGSHHGKVILLNFWATWCKPCREEMPALDAFYRAHRAQGFEVIAVSIESAADLPKINAATKGLTFPVALAANADTQGYGRPWRLPISYVIDRRGVLRFDGARFAKTLDAATLDRIVVPLLHEGADTPVRAATIVHADQ